MDFKVEISKLISLSIDMDIEEIYDIIEIPPKDHMGDYSFPCFKFSKDLHKSPIIIAKAIFSKIQKPDFLEYIEVKGPYINFFINKSIYAQEVLKEVYEQKSKYGMLNIGNGKTILIDYSSPNIAKPFHVGHLRSTVIGNAIKRIYSSLGYNCIGINHLGDWGTQFGKLIVAYKKWGNKECIEKNGIQELMKIYVKFHDEAEKNPSLDDEARAWFVKMQDKDSEALELWKWFYDISIKEFERVYNMLDVKFDAYTGESFYNDKMDSVIQELKDKNLLIESEGALIVELEDMPPCLIVRKDGGTLYATRDITAALYRKKTYNFDKCLYLTALDQNLHFAQVFKVIEKMGYDWHKDLVHIPFGLVGLEGGKLSTRHGNVVLMEDLLNQAINETTKIIEDKNPDIENKEEIARQVGIGAVIFNDLYNSRIKDVVFSWSKMLNFDGETGPYVQYTHARACSILRKADVDFKFEDIDFSLITDKISIDVIKLINSFGQKLQDAANKFEPSILARYIMDLAQAFNKFYHDNPILNSEENLKNARLFIVFAVKTVIASGLNILGINSPQQM